MKIGIIGGDRRFDLLGEFLRAHHSVLRSPDLRQISTLDVIVTQNPVQNGVEMEDILLHMRPDAQLFLHGMGQCGIPAGVRCTDLLKDEAFVRQNAELTAEGAICAAMQATHGAIWGSRCLVVGYGRIAQALVRMLTGLGAHCTVAARKPEARQSAISDGADACDTRPETLGEMLALADYTFSTPPAPLLTEAVLQHARPDAPVIDLASPPFGVDLAASQRLGVRAWRESGLPGRYCPAAAAKLMAEFILRRISGPMGD